LQLQELVTYVTGDYSTPLEKMHFPQAECIACHSRDDIAAKTANYQVNYTVSADLVAQLTKAGYDLKQHSTINPHTVPVDNTNSNNPHVKGGPMPECTACHSMHDDSPNLGYCFSCHHSGTFAPCVTCHSTFEETNKPTP
jgi:hypothetical protein